MWLIVTEKAMGRIELPYAMRLVIPIMAWKLLGIGFIKLSHFNGIIFIDNKNVTLYAIVHEST